MGNRSPVNAESDDCLATRVFSFSFVRPKLILEIYPSVLLMRPVCDSRHKAGRKPHAAGGAEEHRGGGAWAWLARSDLRGLRVPPDLVALLREDCRPGPRARRLRRQAVPRRPDPRGDVGRRRRARQLRRRAAAVPVRAGPRRQGAHGTARILLPLGSIAAANPIGSPFVFVFLIFFPHSNCSTWPMRARRRQLGRLWMSAPPSPNLGGWLLRLSSPLGFLPWP